MVDQGGFPLLLRPRLLHQREVQILWWQVRRHFANLQKMEFFCRLYKKWKWCGKMPHFSQNRKILQIIFLSNPFICVT